MQPPPRISRTEFELVLVLYELGETGTCSSLFQLASLLLLEVSWTWRVSRRAQEHGLIWMERVNGGAPKRVGLTQLGRELAQISNHNNDTLIHIIMADKALGQTSLLAATELHRRLHEA